MGTIPEQCLAGVNIVHVTEQFVKAKQACFNFKDPESLSLAILD